MGEIIESKIRKKDKVMSGWRGVSVQWDLRRAHAHACSRQEEGMRSETDRLELYELISFLLIYWDAD